MVKWFEFPIYTSSLFYGGEWREVKVKHSKTSYDPTPQSEECDVFHSTISAPTQWMNSFTCFARLHVSVPRVCCFCLLVEEATRECEKGYLGARSKQRVLHRVAKPPKKESRDFPRKTFHPSVCSPANSFGGGSFVQMPTSCGEITSHPSFGFCTIRLWAV